MSVDSESSYSRLPAGVGARPPKTAPRPTRTQRALEATLFVVFGLIITLAGVALYATNHPNHQRVPNRVEAGLTADRVNVLLIGSSLRTRKAGDQVVDIESLMLLSVQPSTGRAAVMSVPVDLWVKVGRFGQRPLRAAHVLGDASGYPGAGVGLTIDTVEDIVKQPVHGYVRLSTQDVSRIVEAVGGVNIRNRHLNGADAVHYAYSRRVARLKRDERQQELVLASLPKLLQDEWTFPELGPLTATNLTPQQMQKLGAALGQGNLIRRISFGDYFDVFRVDSVAYRGSAVRPRGGDFTPLQKIVATAFSVSL